MIEGLVTKKPGHGLNKERTGSEKVRTQKELAANFWPVKAYCDRTCAAFNEKMQFRTYNEKKKQVIVLTNGALLWSHANLLKRCRYPKTLNQNYALLLAPNYRYPIRIGKWESTPM